MTERTRAALAPSLGVMLAMIAGCGGTALTSSDAAALLPKAIEGTLSKTLPAVTYCMTATPDFSFGNMSQTDFVATFQSVKDKSTLYDALAAGLVRIDLKEFRFDPAKPAPDPSCAAIHAQSKAAGHSPQQIRLAVVRTALTQKAGDAGLSLGAPVDVATREFVAATSVAPERGGAVVKYTWRWKPTKLGEAIAFADVAAKDATARFRKVDGAWRVEDAGIAGAGAR